MAIKIIKDGTTKFEATCPRCGCEFSYELEDIIVDRLSCPCCGETIYHKKRNNYDTTTTPSKPYNPHQINDLVYRPQKFPDWATKTDNSSGCEGCPSNLKYLTAPYVGDSPCQWCPRSLLKITCISKLGVSNED